MRKNASESPAVELEEPAEAFDSVSRQNPDGMNEEFGRSALIPEPPKTTALGHPCPGPAPASASPSVQPLPIIEGEPLWESVLNLLEHMHRRALLSRNIRKIEQHLTRLMNERGADVLETPFGTVSRRRRPNGAFQWVVSAVDSRRDIEDGMS